MGQWGALLGLDEEPAVEVRDGNGASLSSAACASNRLPRALGSLGSRRPISNATSPSTRRCRTRRRDWERTGGAPRAAALFSRLAIDCNVRPKCDAIAAMSETTVIQATATCSGGAAGRDRRDMATLP
jgi:predicted N-formylglutamate amidohydrolase